MVNWVEACDADDIEEEDVIRFDYGGRTFAVYRSPDDEYFATDGIPRLSVPRKVAAAAQAVETSWEMDSPEPRILPLRSAMSCSPISS